MSVLYSLGPRRLAARVSILICLKRLADERRWFATERRSYVLPMDVWSEILTFI